LEGLTNFCPLLDHVAEITTEKKFLLLDIGCSGRIDRQWRRLGRRLRAIGIDPNTTEIQRLAAREKNPNVTYLNAFATIGPEHPFARKKQGRPDWGRDPGSRLSAFQYKERLCSTGGRVAQSVDGAVDSCSAVAPAGPVASIVVPEYLAQSGITSLDFLKVDVDGKDFDILNSFDQALADLAVLGVGIEVNFFGSDCDTDNSFHNVDRFLKAHGFELFQLTTRHYSVGALPSRFVGAGPGPTEIGRIYQGDAMYARDLGAGDGLANSLNADKILNLMAIFAVFDLPDCAAELALKFRPILSPRFDVDRMLDLLTAQVEGRIFAGASYKRHVAGFTQRSGSFRATRNPAVMLARMLKKEFLKLRGRSQLVKLERAGK